jgi:hypothetical protein
MSAKTSGRPVEKSTHLPTQVALAEGLIDLETGKLWPTPTANTRPNEGNVRMYRALIEAGEMTEEEATAILGKSPWEAQGKVPEKFAKPQARDYRTGQAKRWENPERSRNLNDQVAMWPTPTARDWKSPGYPESAKLRESKGHAQPLPEKVGGQLNPEWVTWLMGYPPMWTCCH